MPKIFEYLGFIFFFYSNDHDPVHVHVQKGEIELKVEFFYEDGVLKNVSIRKNNNAKKNLTPTDREKIRKFVERYNDKIVQKWNDAKEGKKIKCEKINKEIK